MKLKIQTWGQQSNIMGPCGLIDDKTHYHSGLDEFPDRK